MSTASAATVDHSPFRVLALAGTCAASLLFVVAGQAIARHGDRALHFGWSAAYDGRALIVVDVASSGPARDQLQLGDRIVAIDGDHRISRLPRPSGWLHTVRRVDATGDGAAGFLPLSRAYTLRIERKGEARVVHLLATETHSADQRRLSQGLLAAGAVWCIVPALISLFRPGQGIARLAYAVCMFTGLSFLAEARLPSLPWLSQPWHTVLLISYPFAPLHMALAFDFYRRFPAVLPGSAWRITSLLLYGVCGVLSAEGPMLDAGVRVVAPERLPQVRTALAPLDRWIIWPESLVYGAVGLGIIAALVRNYRSVQSIDGRRRLAWLLWGTLLGLGPFTILLTAESLCQLMSVDIDLSSWLIPASLFTTLIPVVLGYAVIKHRVFDIKVVVRKGLQYLFARNALRTLLFVPLAVLAYGIIVHRDQPIGHLLLTNRVYLYLLAVAVVSLWWRARLMLWVDRRFFREAYDRERMLVELIEDVQELESASSVSRLVSQALESAFHPESLFIWYRDHDSPHLTLSYSSGGYVYRVELEPGSPLMKLIEARRTIIELPLADEDVLPEADRRWLAEANVAYLIPIVGSGPDTLGVVMLGPKKSEEPYSATDLKLLQAMARQIGIGRENLRLHARVDHDRRVRHDVLSRLDTGLFNLLKECPRCGRCYDASVTLCDDDRSELTLSLPIERTLEDKYRLDRLLGRGGMGAVYEATDLRLGRRVAVKVLLGREFGNQVALRRFAREAQACARLSHPNIVTIFDFGRAGADGAYLVMELVHGTTLRVALNRHGRLAPQLAMSVFAQICAGIAAAHVRGIVHRDLKPENVLLAPGESDVPLVKVLDFGLAKTYVADSDDASSLTGPGMIVGTLTYMAPEQLTGGAIDHRCDIFSIGVIAAEALGGRRPFTGRNHGELLLSILNDAVDLDNDVPAAAELQRVLRRATARDPSARYQTVMELSNELASALRSSVSSAPPAKEDSTTSG